LPPCDAARRPLHSFPTRRSSDLMPAPEPDLAALADDPIRDDLLGLVFTACHPSLPTDARVALTLKVVGGLSTDEIARTFLVSRRSEEHTSELQSRENLVCRLLLE